MLSRSFPLLRYAFQPPVGVSTRLVHTPVLWAYWPLMMVARLGQHSAFETKAFSKLMPFSLSTERVLGMYLRSSFRMSSVRMKTMFGLVLSASTSLGMLLGAPKESSTTKATEASSKMIFLIPSIPLEWGGGKNGDQTSTPTSCNTLSMVLEPDKVHPPHGHYPKLCGPTYSTFHSSGLVGDRRHARSNLEH